MIKLDEKEIEFIKNNEAQFREYLGKKSDYYISAWTIKPKYNMASAFGGVLWFGYKGLYLFPIGIVTMFLIFDLFFLVLNIPYTKEFDKMLAYGCTGLFGVLGNYLFYHKVKNDILKNKNPANKYLGIFIILIIVCLYLFTSVMLEEIFLWGW